MKIEISYAELVENCRCSGSYGRCWQKEISLEEPNHTINCPLFCELDLCDIVTEKDWKKADAKFSLIDRVGTIFRSKIYRYRRMENLEDFQKKERKAQKMREKSKLENCIRIINRTGKGQLRLEKLLWLIDKAAFLKFAHKLTGLIYANTKTGAVPQKLKHFKVSGEPDLSCFEQEELDVISSVLDKYGHMTDEELIKIAHDLAWATFDDGEEIPFEMYLSSPENPREIPSIHEKIEERERSWK